MGKFSDYLDSMKTQTDTLREVVSEKSGVDCSELSIKGVADVVKDIQTGGKDPVLQEKSVSPAVFSQEVKADEGYDGLSKVKVGAVTSEIDVNILPNNIRSGVSILGVQGNLATDKPDQTKTVTPTTSRQEVVADTGYELGRVIVEAVEPSDYYKDEESLNVTPSTESQKITPTANKVFNEVNVGAVTSAIDSNIVADNIKKDVTILGVTGTLEEGGAEDLTEELTAQDEAITRLTVAIDDLPTPKCSCGSIGTGNYYLKVIDYDGTILAEKRLNNGDTYTLPNAPSHDGLVFQEWSCSQEIVDGVITIANNNVMVGATYTTASGLSEFDITLTKATGLDVTLNMNGTKNWGDGTSDDLTTHTYTDYGDYTITCNGTTMSTGSNRGVFGQKDGANNYYCKSIRFGTGVTTINSYAFRYCYSLTKVIIPKSVTKINSYAFQYCISLKSIIIPQGGTDISNANIFDHSYLLISVVIPKNIRSIGNSSFAYCYSLTNIAIPRDASFSANAFELCYSLTNLVIPQGVKNFYVSFSGCYSITKYDFTQYTEIPTNGVSSLFPSINKLCKIYVPDALYDEWIVATNWVIYVDYIYKASEMEA